MAYELIGAENVRLDESNSDNLANWSTKPVKMTCTVAEDNSASRDMTVVCPMDEHLMERWSTIIDKEPVIAITASLRCLLLRNASVSSIMR